MNIQMPGLISRRWGSLASKGRPLLVRLPASTQLFEASSNIRGLAFKSPSAAPASAGAAGAATLLRTVGASSG